MNNSFIENLNKVSLYIGEIKKFNENVSEKLIEQIKSIGDLNFSDISMDLSKGNYLGKRKLDIDLSINYPSNSVGNTIRYKKATIVLVDGRVIDMPFVNSTGGTLELSSYSDIKAYIVSHPLYVQYVKNTEAVIDNDTYSSLPTIIRFRDADGYSSNISRVGLGVDLDTSTVTPVNLNPIYSWVDTTSSLQVLANSMSDAVSLFNIIGEITYLNSKKTELEAVYLIRDKINALYFNLEEILRVDNNTEAAIAINTNINQKAEQLTNLTNQIQGFKINVVFKNSYESASSSYSTTTNTLTLGVPKGEKGEAFTIDAYGSLANKSTYDNEPEGFSYLALDTSPTKIFFKINNTTGAWSVGTPFGQGEKGDIGVSIADISNTGVDENGSDIYTITLTNGDTSTFTVSKSLLIKDDVIGNNSVMSSYETWNILDDRFAVLGIQSWKNTAIVNKIKLVGVN